MAFWNAANLRKKITIMVIGVAVLPMVLVVGMTVYQKQKLQRQIGTELDNKTREQLTSIAKDMYALCKTQQESLEQTIEANLAVAADVLNRKGNVRLLPESATWEATNQFTKASTTVQLPKVAAGGAWLGQNRNQAAYTPVVDDAVRLVGGACTVFQRMNPQGDMLRVATNVLKQDKTRAIGTYIPAVEPNGKPNAVVAAALSGQRYVGRAFVVDSWYVTAYEPLKDASGEVVGMLFVGVKQENVASLRASIMSTKVGKSGYVFVLGGSGDQEGRYIISQDGARDGENILGAKDADGKEFIKTMVGTAVAQRDGEVSFQRYPWKNSGDKTARQKIAAISYFEPWDWVIGVSAYEDEFRTAVARTDSAMNWLLWAVLLSGLVAAAVTVSIASKFVSKKLTAPIEALSGAADAIAVGDIEQEIEYESSDEIGSLADSFRRLIGYMSEVATASERVSRGDLDVEVRPKSDHDVLSKNFGRVVETLRGLVTESEALSRAAVAGELGTRGDAEKFEGGYREMMQGFNDTLDAVVGPLRVSAEYMDRISRGDVPEQITDEYNGDFNEIKNSLNTCIGAIDAMRQDVRTMCIAALEGRLEVRADTSKHSGMYSKIVQGLNDILDTVLKPVNEATEVLARMAENDLTARVVGDYQGDHAKIKDSLNTAVESVSGLIDRAGVTSNKVLASARDLASTSDEVGKASQSIAEIINQVASGSTEQSKTVTGASQSMEQLGQAIQEVSKGAQSQAKTVEETVGLIQQISQAIESVAGTAQMASAASLEVADVAKSGGGSVGKSVEGMARIKETSANVAEAVSQLGENSKQIGAIVETIDDIAEQTNLLALNAAIEAARAGEHGKGFAVVADEVRKLAERSSKATKEIADLISSIQQMTEHAVDAMQAGTQEVETGTELAKEAGAALESILTAVNAIVGQIEDVSAATQQMSASSAEVARAVESLSAVTEESSAATEEMAASSSEVTMAVEQVAAVSQQNAASAEEVAAAAEEQNASVEEMAAAAEELAKIAEELQTLVNQFKIEDETAVVDLEITEGGKGKTRQLKKAA